VESAEIKGFTVFAFPKICFCHLFATYDAKFNLMALPTASHALL